MKILIVEDDVIAARSLAEQLSDLHYDVLEPAIDADAALRTAIKHSPHVCLIDIGLGFGQDGIDLALTLRRQVNTALVFLTALTDRSTVLRASAARPNGYLIKPASPDGLFAAVEVAFAHYWIEASPDHEISEAGLSADVARRIGEVVTFIETNLETSFTTAQLARRIDLRPEIFTQIFKSVTGSTPYAFGFERRLELARGLLRENDIALADIALSVRLFIASAFLAGVQEAV